MILPHMNPISPFGYPVVEVVPVAALVVFVLEKVPYIARHDRRIREHDTYFGTSGVADVSIRATFKARKKAVHAPAAV